MMKKLSITKLTHGKLLFSVILGVTLTTVAAVATIPIPNAQSANGGGFGGLTSEVLTETVLLNGFPGNIATPHRIDLIDATGSGTVTVGHIVAVLPNQDDDDTCDEGDPPFAGLTILVGDAELGLASVEFENVEIPSGPTINFNGDGDKEAVCIYHVSYTNEDAPPAAGHIVDNVFQNGSGFRLPAGSSINITVTLDT